MAEGRLSRLAPWGGLIAGVLAWSVQQQFLADVLHYGCPPAQRWIGIVSGCIAAAVVIAGGLVSLCASAWRARGDLGARTFIARISVVAAAFFLIAVVMTTAATLLVRPCSS